MGNIEQLQRSKRYLTVFAGLLFLDLVAGITGDQGNEGSESGGTLLGIPLESLDSISLVLATVTAFYIFRVLNFRSAEGEKYKDTLQYRIDDYGHLFIGFVAFVNGLTSYFSPNLYERFGPIKVILGLAILSIIAVILLALTLNMVRNQFISSRISLDMQISFALREPPWFLVFANNVGQTLAENSNYKKISFERKGTIGLGQNRNEFTWKIQNGFLEIFDKSENIFSRFSYDESQRMFKATGDSDLQALPSQRIVRDVNEWDREGRP